MSIWTAKMWETSAERAETWEVKVSPLDYGGGGIILPIDGEGDRWVHIDLITAAPMLPRALERYVRMTDEWEKEGKPRALGQDQRLAFVELLRHISAGCERLARSVEENYAKPGLLPTDQSL